MTATEVLKRARFEMSTMQSRVDAILAVGEIVDYLCRYDTFGDQYESLLKEDSKDLAEAIALIDQFLRAREGLS